MKKLFALFLALILLLSSSALALEIDYASLSVDELQEIIIQARNAIAVRNAKAEDKIFLVDDPAGVTVYLTGNAEKNWMDQYALEVVVINNTGTALSIAFDSIAINGWETNTLFSGITDVSGGKKKKDSISLDIEGAELTDPAAITDVELVFHTYDSETFSTVTQYDAVTLFYDGHVWTKK